MPQCHSVKSRGDHLSDAKGPEGTIRTAPIDKPSLEETTPSLWECGEPYKFPIPPPEGDPWKILLTPLIEKDKEQCEAWKDEVQNLLIFAGLFSAVVTAFVVETYHGLQEDPNDTIIMLLTRISTNLENPLNSTNDLPFSPPPFIPPSSSVRVNIYFFVSLILSLATVLIGIVSLQWLREHQSYTGSFTPQNRFAAIHMRSEALEKWRVPEIFSALPLLLQSALVLFFVGTIEFLWDIDVMVAIPVAVIIVLTLAFLLLTTMLPTFQGFILHHPNLKINDEVPVQCPYKSPQSRAFRRLITSSKLVFFPLSFIIASVYWTGVRICLLPGQILSLKPFRNSVDYCVQVVERVSAVAARPASTILSEIDQRGGHILRLDSKSWKGFDYMTPYIYDFWRIKTSFEFDVMWLSIRDNYFQSTRSEDSWLYQRRFDHREHGAIYDATLGICKEFAKEDVNMNADVESPIFTAYHCALDLSSINQLHGMELITAVRSRNQYIATLLDYDQLTPLSPFPDMDHDLSLQVLAEENAFVLLHAAHNKMFDLQLASPQIARHLAEVTFRLLGYLFSKPRPMQNTDGIIPEVIFAADELYIMRIYDIEGQPFTTQWALTLHVYFQTWDDPDIHEVDFQNSFHTHPFLRSYIWNFWKEVDDEFTKHIVSDCTIRQITSTLRLIGDTLQNLWDRGTSSRDALDCLFFPSAMYAQICKRLLGDHPVLGDAVMPIIPLLARCRADISARSSRYSKAFGDGETDEDQEMVLFSDAWWEVLLEPDGSASEHNGRTDISSADKEVADIWIEFPLAPSERRKSIGDMV